MTEPGTPPVIGIIGGSGIYEIAGLDNVRWQRVHSPFGVASDAVMQGELNGQKLVFLPRHGRGHRIPPSELNFRANIDVLKRCGVTEILSLSAVGSLREDLPPGAIFRQGAAFHLRTPAGCARWSFEGYAPSTGTESISDPVEAITPAAIRALLRDYVPQSAL